MVDGGGARNYRRKTAQVGLPLQSADDIDHLVDPAIRQQAPSEHAKFIFDVGYGERPIGTSLTLLYCNVLFFSRLQQGFHPYGVASGGAATIKLRVMSNCYARK